MKDGEEGTIVPADSTLFVEEDRLVDLGDVMLMDLGEAVYRAKLLFGENRVTVDTPNGEFEVEPPGEDPFVDFDERLKAVAEGSRELANASGASYSRTMELLLVLDGWSWNKDVFRAPIWMNDHREIPIGEARKLKGLEWLTGSSLETRSKLKEGSVKLSV